MRPYAGTAVVVRAPAAACLGPADHYLGLLAGTMGDLALAEVHHEAALRLARRMGSRPSWPRPKWSWPGPCAGADRPPTRSGSPCCCAMRRGAALAMGLHRLAQRAAAPG